MDDGRVVAVEVDKATEDLPRPALQDLVVHVLVFLPVPAHMDHRQS